MPSILSLFTANQGNNGLSSYKAVIAQNTDHTAIQTLQAHRDDHDLLFLCAIYTGEIKLGENAKTAALSQLYKYLAGAAELVCIFSALSSLANGNLLGIIAYPAICFSLNKYETYSQSLIKSHNSGKQLLKDLEKVSHATLGDVIKNNLTNLTVKQIVQNSANICSNVANVCISNFSFFRKITANKPVAAQHNNLQPRRAI